MFSSPIRPNPLFILRGLVFYGEKTCIVWLRRPVTCAAWGNEIGIRMVANGRERDTSREAFGIFSGIPATNEGRNLKKPSW